MHTCILLPCHSLIIYPYVHCTCMQLQINHPLYSCDNLLLCKLGSRDVEISSGVWHMPMIECDSCFIEWTKHNHLVRLHVMNLKLQKILPLQMMQHRFCFQVTWSIVYWGLMNYFSGSQIWCFYNKGWTRFKTCLYIFSYAYIMRRYLRDKNPRFHTLSQMQHNTHPHQTSTSSKMCQWWTSSVFPSPLL
mgnify:CR=1 FL=1